MKGKRGISAYKNNQTQTRGEVASPYRLVKVLFENLADNLSRARGAIEQDRPSVKGECIGRSMDIINALRTSLDHSIGGEISANLDGLYRYCNSCLIKASSRNDVEELDKAASVINQIKTSWDQLESKLNEAQ